MKVKVGDIVELNYDSSYLWNTDWKGVRLKVQSVNEGSNSIEVSIIFKPDRRKIPNYEIGTITTIYETNRKYYKVINTKKNHLPEWM